jgi:putative tricarboxylic transport membrane protein
MPSTTGNVQPNIEAGVVKAYGITGPARMQVGALANLPTFREQGLDVVYDNWRAIVAPKGLPPEQIAYWENVFKAINESTEWKQVADQLLVVPNYRDSKALREVLDAETQESKSILTELGLIK